MSIGTSILLLGAGAIGLFWLFRLVAVEVTRRHRQVLHPESNDDLRAGSPKVSIVMAAKDEEANILLCVRSLLAQDYPNFELIVVDDRSSDLTPVILKTMEKHAGDRLRVITIETLRDGWFGKSAAMHQGVQAATGEWLLFTDADCQFHSPKTLSIAMADVAAHDVDFLSITPMLETPSVWERIIQPVCALTLITWFLPYRVNNPEKKTAYSNGAFMLMRRGCYDGIGGHESTRVELNEDIVMARAAKRMGYTLRVTENDGLYSTRMYETMSGAWRGWSRLFAGCLGRMDRLGIAAGLIALLSLGPWVGLVVSLYAVSTADPIGVFAWRTAMWAWVGVIGLKQLVQWRVYPMTRTHPIWSLTHVLGSVVVLGMLLNAMSKVLGMAKVTWHSTTYAADGSIE